ncbi:nickel-dependent hydrogenase large subunit [Breoghania sp. JC706]|uniref:hydrogenase large subunit n=1 Tax=Breoghania sp. JC706 TaxID=3117732 RepID=UPI00300A1BA9
MPYQIPIGPFHPALEEPYKLSFNCVADTVDKVSVDVGFSFRGIEILAQKREWLPAITLVERVCGICSNVHATSFCMAAERIAGIEIPKRAQYIRTIMGELERMHSHLLWAGLAAEFMGYETAFMEVFNLRETIMDMLESISGNRVNYGMNRIGGVNRDIPDPLQYVSTLETAAKTLEKVVIPAFMDNPTARSRMGGVGILTKEDAIAWGTVGPVARASGLAIDVRSDLPYLAYEELGFRIVTQESCDVQARVVVRALELLESIRLIIAALKGLPAGPLRAFEGLPTIPAGEATTYCEAPRGEVFYYVASDGSDKPARVRIRTPSFVNIPALEAMMPGQQFANTSLIQASVDPCLSCTDR